MPQTAIISPQIIDSTSIGRDLITAADQAAAQAIIGVTGVDTSADYTWTGDHTFDGSATFTDTFDAVDGDFSGDVTVGGNVLGGSSGHAIKLSQGLVGESALRVASTGGTVLAWGYTSSSYAYITTTFFPSVDGSFSSGKSTNRWSNVYSVDGSFSGNLISETGGSIRQYGLGIEGDADT